MLKDLLFVVPPNMNLRDLPKWAATAGRFRKWSGRDLHEAVRLFTMSAADFLDEWFEDERVKGALATQAIIGAWCGPMTPGSAYVLMHHWIGEVDGHAGAWGWVKGGMGGISQAMARAAEAAGAEIRASAEVDRVAINARAGGGGSRSRTVVGPGERVVSCEPPTTVLSLIGEERYRATRATSSGTDPFGSAAERRALPSCRRSRRGRRSDRTRAWSPCRPREYLERRGTTRSTVA